MSSWIHVVHGRASHEHCAQPFGMISISSSESLCSLVSESAAPAHHVTETEADRRVPDYDALFEDDHVNEFPTYVGEGSSVSTEGWSDDDDDDDDDDDNTDEWTDITYISSDSSSDSPRSPFYMPPEQRERAWREMSSTVRMCACQVRWCVCVLGLRPDHRSERSCVLVIPWLTKSTFPCTDT